MCSAVWIKKIMKVTIVPGYIDARLARYALACQ